MRRLDSCNLGLLLGHPFLHESIILCLLFLLVVKSATLEGQQMTAALKTHGCDEPLNFGSISGEWRGEKRLIRQLAKRSEWGNVRLGIGFGIFFLTALHFSPDNILPDIILFPQIKELPDLSSPLRSQSLRQYIIRQTSDFTFTLLHDDQTQHGYIRADDATPNGFALALTRTAGTVAGMTIGEEEFDSVGEEDSLFHGESLFVITTCDTDDVTFPFVTNGVDRDFLGDFLLVEDTAGVNDQWSSSLKELLRIVRTIFSHHRDQWVFVPQ
jgi:hypothetical protein